MTKADELSRLFEAERAVHPPAQSMERGLSRLLADVAMGAAPLPIATGSLKLGLSLVSKWLIVGFVVGLGGAGLSSRLLTTHAAAAPTAPTHGIAMPASPAVREAVTDGSVTPPPAGTASERAVVSITPASAATPAGSAADAAADGTTFDEELRLISAAKREQAAGRARAADGWLLEHARRFPNGVFAVDREALHVLVACGTKKQPALAQAFAREHATSPMVARLVRACGGSERAAGAEADFSEIEK